MLKEWWIQFRLNQYNGSSKVTTNEKLEVFKKDLIKSLDADKNLRVLITVPTIAVRDYYLSDPLFVNFYSGRVSFREKKLKQNNKMFFLVERL